METLKRFLFSKTISVRHALDLGNATEPFRVPRRFTGHLYITGNPDEQAVIVMGCDDQGNIEPAENGFSVLVGSSKSFETVYLFSRALDPPVTLRLGGLPAQFQTVMILFVGSAEDPSGSVGVVGYLEE